MVHLRLRRLLPFLRVLALALFALGLVLQPVMAAVGEMHELAHDPSGTHSHDLHVDELDAELAAAGEQNQGGAKTTHVLLHFSQDRKSVVEGKSVLVSVDLGGGRNNK